MTPRPRDILLLGTHVRRMGWRGQATLPAAWRGYFYAAGPPRLALTIGFSPCLILLRVEEARRRVPRAFRKMLREVTVDAQGRFTVPPDLRAILHLGRNVVLVGCVDVAELWAEHAWNEYQRDPSSGPEAAAGELGL